MEETVVMKWDFSLKLFNTSYIHFYVQSLFAMQNGICHEHCDGTIIFRLFLLIWGIF